MYIYPPDLISTLANCLCDPISTVRELNLHSLNRSDDYSNCAASTWVVNLACTSSTNLFGPPSYPLSKPDNRTTIPCIKMSLITIKYNQYIMLGWNPIYSTCILLDRVQDPQCLSYSFLSVERFRFSFLSRINP